MLLASSSTEKKNPYVSQGVALLHTATMLLPYIQAKKTDRSCKEFLGHSIKLLKPTGYVMHQQV